MYRSLRNISSGTELAQRVALGTYITSSSMYNYGVTLNKIMFTHCIEHTRGMEEVLSPGEVTVARSYWPLKDKRRLNVYQQKAIDLAWRNKFTMIQGPPGIDVYSSVG